MLLVFAAPLTAQEGIVRAALFYSPTCPHCREVMEVHLPPILERYGDRLQIAAVNTMTGTGAALYRAMVAEFDVPSERQGVPTLVVGSSILVGSLEIPTQFPGLVDAALVAGGVDWPEVPQLGEAIERGGTEGVDLDALDHSGGQGGASAGSMADRFMMDPAGNLLSVAMLFLMVTTLVGVARHLAGGSFVFPTVPSFAVPLLAAVGLGIAAYLSYVEMVGADAVCGPVGDCNAVQQSEYARLFGWLPVGLMGAAGYGAILAASVFGGAGPARRRVTSRRAVWWMALGATLYSLYLTFLEPFVIGATCAWCLGSAAVATLILLAATSQLGPPNSGRRAAR